MNDESSGKPDSATVSALFGRYGFTEPWIELPATGVANWIYATEAVVLRVAANHGDSVSDARTESVAAPAARAAGIRTPEMLAFDDTRELVDRPYSLWERLHLETLGLMPASAETLRRLLK